MMKISMKLYLHALLCFRSAVTSHGQGEDLVEPNEIASTNGVLDITMVMEYGTWTIPGTTFALEDTRLLDGILPGNTLRINPGDTLRILYENNLELQDGAVNEGTNVLSYPDHSNLHFHGGHVSGELPSDDVRMKVAPQESFQYETVFPENHMGGTHWIHPHVHGASTVQVGGGAACALIVNDAEGFSLPDEIAGVTEVVLMVQTIDSGKLRNALEQSQDSKTTVTGDNTLPTAFRVVNGQYQPNFKIVPNTWYRFRIIMGGWLKEPLDLTIPGCEMQLLAKDGVYINDFPRTIVSAPIPAGGRADIMVLCPPLPSTGAQLWTVLDFENTIMSLEVEEVDFEATELTAWDPVYPDYLSDLRESSVTDGCDCETNIGGCDTGGGAGIFCINNQLMNEELYIHTVPFGSIAERTLGGAHNHPYHHHVYPFQITTNFNGMDANDAAYYQVGDWHDVIYSATATPDPMVFRFKADVHMGVMMLHCHILEHEDKGTMAQEFIADSTASCACSTFVTEPIADSSAPPSIEASDATALPTTEPIADSSAPPSIEASDATALPTTESIEAVDCFSPYVTTHVLGKNNPVFMKDLAIGDKVLTGNGKYETVFVMDHFHHSKKTEYIQLHYKENDNTNNDSSHFVGHDEINNHELLQPLEITPNHMVFILSTDTISSSSSSSSSSASYDPIPAIHVKVGDHIQSITGPMRVTRIEKIHRNGLYNPLTTGEDGTIVVTDGGLIASTYSTFSTSPSSGTANASNTKDTHLEIEGYGKLILVHDAINLASISYRNFCTSISATITLFPLCNQHDELAIPSLVLRKVYSNLWEKSNDQNYEWVTFCILFVYVSFLIIINTVTKFKLFVICFITIMINKRQSEVKVN